MRVVTVACLAALATLVAVPSAASTADVAAGGSFVDDDGSIHEPDIEALAAAGIVRGCNPPRNHLYCPKEGLSRAQAATILVRTLGLDPASSDVFTDDAGVHESDINSLAAAGITKGCNPPDNDRFCPDRELTRGELAALLQRALDLPPSAVDAFGDDDASVYEPAIDAVAAAGITKGCNPPDNDRFCPDALVLRDQAASFLVRALGMEPVHAPRRDRATRLGILAADLAAKGFMRESAVGRPGALEAAIVAFHKELRLPRTDEWSVTDWVALVRYSGPDLPARPGQPDRLEIDLAKQVLYLMEDGDVTAIMPVSSGNGEVFAKPDGSLAVARTPRGSFTIRAHIDGWRYSYLGALYRPWYFRGGYAVHGSQSVPPYPASHGCVRIPLWDADFLEDRLAVGMPVHVWDS